MSPEELLEQDFGLIAEVVRAHARERPRAPALIKDETLLTYGELDRLMDRVAAALAARSGRERRSDRDLRAVFDRVRASCSSAPCAQGSPWRRWRLHRAQRAWSRCWPTAARNCCFWMPPSAKALAGAQLPRGLRCISLDGGLEQAFDAWLAPIGAKPAPVVVDPAAPFNIIYSSGRPGRRKASCNRIVCGGLTCDARPVRVMTRRRSRSARRRCIRTRRS